MTIAQKLIRWYQDNCRDLPWRDTSDPYRIWISEVILQQTRVAQGLEYYRRFIDRFPDVHSLAQAEEDQVLKYWQGLGYYSRARNLHAAAKTISDRFSGNFPASYRQIRELKGVGDYTAAAIASIAFGLPYAAVDGNVYRVLSRLYALDIPIDTVAGKKYFTDLASSLLDPNNPGIFNQALMEFGAIQCVPRSPDCALCSLQKDCRALALGIVDQVPVKQGKIRTRDRYFHYLDIRCEDSTLLCKRSGKDIWQGLYEFPLIETSLPATFSALEKEGEIARLVGKNYRLEKTVAMPVHVLSHQRIHACFYRIETDKLPLKTDCLLIHRSSLYNYAISRLTELYLKKE